MAVLHRAAFALVFCLLAAFPALAAGPLVPYLVEDLTPGERLESQTLQFWSVTLGEVVFFAADGEKSGVWRTDGTAAGTHRIYDELPGRHRQTVHMPVVWNGFLHYPVVAGDRTWLYRTDGTTPGTTMVAQVSDWYGGAPCGDGKLCFGSHGSTVSVTDGTAAGTVELLSTASGYETYNLREMTAMGGRVYFNAFDEQNGLCMIVPYGVDSMPVCGELWTTDGTVAGTHLFKDILPGSAPGAPQNLFASSAGKLYFAAADPALPQARSRAGAWVSDGTPGGTRMLPTVSSDWAFPPKFVELGGRVFYTAGDGDLFETDGTVAGTHSFRERAGSPDVMLQPLGEVAGRIVLLAAWHHRDPELWAWDGERLLTLGGISSNGVRSIGLLQSTGLLWFITQAGELWSTDGTRAGTGYRFSIPTLDGTAYAVAITPTRLYVGEGYNRYVSDGTEAGTHEIDLDLRLAKNTWTLQGKVLNGKYFFIGEEKFGASDGTAAGTEVLLERPGVEPFAHEGHTYFYEDQTLWKTDGTRQGTVRARDWLGVESPVPPAFIGEQAIFAGLGGSGRLLRRDRAGTLHDLGVRDQVFSSFTGVEGGVAFWAGAAPRLMFTDGTAARTVATGFQWGGKIVSLGSKAVFGARKSGDSTLRLWVTDFTAGGTRPLKELPTGNPRHDVTTLFTWRNLAIFRIGPTLLGDLWRTDGTTEGTYPLAAGAFDSVLADNDELVLVRFKNPTGYEVWTSDGTAAGTTLRDVHPEGARAGDPFVMAGGGVGVLYSPTPTEVHIRNHRTGAIQVIEGHVLQIAPSGVGSGNLVFFRGYGRASGVELWAVDLEGKTPSPPAPVSIAYAGTVKTATGLGAAFRVSVGRDGARPPRVIATTADGTLTAASDYVPFTREVVFESDEEVTLVVPLRHADVRGSLSVVLTSPVNAQITEGMATAQIGGAGRRRAVRK